MIWPSNHSIYTAHSAHSHDHQHITKYTQHTTIYATHTQIKSTQSTTVSTSYMSSSIRELVKYGVRGSDGQEVMKSILISSCLVWFSNKGWMGKLWKGWMWRGRWRQSGQKMETPQSPWSSRTVEWQSSP